MDNPIKSRANEPMVGDREQTDAANKSLADALNVSFAFLKVVMVVLLIVYLGSGVFQVEEQNKAVKLVFGKVATDGDGRPVIFESGLYFNFPYPIGQNIEVPVSSQTLNINQAFWVQVQQADIGKDISELPARPLNPERDGSLLTGDANLVMGRFTVRWFVANPADFVVNVGLAEPGESLNPLARAETLVRNAAERGIVHAVAQIEAESFINGTTNMGTATRLAQEMLDQLGTGIDIEAIGSPNHSAPRSAYDAFQAVFNAESDKAQQINKARQDAARILSGAAGFATDPLIDLIEAYEIAFDSGDVAAAEALKQQIDDALTAEAVTVEGGVMPIGGSVAQRINSAKAYRDSLSERLSAEAPVFEWLYARVYGDPNAPVSERPTPAQQRESLYILTNSLWQDMRERVMTAQGVETLRVPTEKLRLDITGDPRIQREREKQLLEAETEAARNRPSTR